MKNKSGYIDDRVLKQAVDKWGVDFQFDKAIEECSELIRAIVRFKNNGIELDLADEIADVKITVLNVENIFKHYFNKTLIDERVDFKMKRLQERINKKDK